MYSDGGNSYHQYHYKQEQHRETEKSYGQIEDWRERTVALIKHHPGNGYLLNDAIVRCLNSQVTGKERTTGVSMEIKSSTDNESPVFL